jgi:hypothetical protein
MSKPIDQAVEALADAITGEYERLKEFGIRANTVGKQVTFSYMKDGKTISRQVKANAAEIEKAVTGIFRDRFGGMMDRQSQTFAGLISNLKDTWAKFLLMVANAGIFDKVKAKLGELYDWVNKLAQDGTLQAWAKNISDALSAAFDWATDLIKNTDWPALAATCKRSARRPGTSRTRWRMPFAPISGGAPRQMPRRLKASRTAGFLPTKRGGMLAISAAPWKRILALTDTGRAEQSNRAPSVPKPQASAGQVQVGGRLQIDVRTPAGTSAA